MARSATRHDQTADRADAAPKQAPASKTKHRPREGTVGEAEIDRLERGATSCGTATSLRRVSYWDLAVTEAQGLRARSRKPTIPYTSRPLHRGLQPNVEKAKTGMSAPPNWETRVQTRLSAAKRALSAGGSAERVAAL